MFLDTIPAINFSIKNHDCVTIKLLLQWQKVCGLVFALSRLNEYVPYKIAQKISEVCWVTWESNKANMVSLKNSQKVHKMCY